MENCRVHKSNNADAAIILLQVAWKVPESKIYDNSTELWFWTWMFVMEMDGPQSDKTSVSRFAAILENKATTASVFTNIFARSVLIFSKRVQSISNLLRAIAKGSGRVTGAPKVWSSICKGQLTKVSSDLATRAWVTRAAALLMDITPFLWKKHYLFLLRDSSFFTSCLLHLH